MSEDYWIYTDYNGRLKQTHPTSVLCLNLAFFQMSTDVEVGFVAQTWLRQCLEDAGKHA